MPVADTVVAAVVAPVLQAYVTPAVLELPFKLILVESQVNILSKPAFTFGAVIFCVTSTWSLAVQPLVGFLTVKV